MLQLFQCLENCYDSCYGCNWIESNSRETLMPRLVLHFFYYINTSTTQAFANSCKKECARMSKIPVMWRVQFGATYKPVGWVWSCLKMISGKEIQVLSVTHARGKKKKDQWIYFITQHNQYCYFNSYNSSIIGIHRLTFLLNLGKLRKRFKHSLWNWNTFKKIAILKFPLLISPGTNILHGYWHIFTEYSYTSSSGHYKTRIWLHHKDCKVWAIFEV